MEKSIKNKNMSTTLNKFEKAPILQCHKCILGLKQSPSDLSLCLPLLFPSHTVICCQHFEPPQNGVGENCHLWTASTFLIQKQAPFIAIACYFSFRPLYCPSPRGQHTVQEIEFKKRVLSFGKICNGSKMKTQIRESIKSMRFSPSA